jgi:putative acetyltransferase
VTVREAQASDISAMAAVAERSYRAGFRGILDEEVLATRTAEFFARRFEIDRERMRVVEAEGQIVGFSLVTDGHVDMLFVDPDAAGQGAGSALLRDAEAIGAKTLESFRDNHRARRFYEKHGWRLAETYERDFIGRMRAFVRYVKP